MAIDFTPTAPAGWFSRMRCIQQPDREETSTGVIGSFLILAERAKDKASFWTTISFYDHDNVGKGSEAENRRYIESKFWSAFYTLEAVSDALDRKDRVPSEEE